MEYLISFLVGWALGVLYIKVKIGLELNKFLKENNIDLADLATEGQPSTEVKIPYLNAETHNDVILLYDSSNFICQGSTLEELAKKALEYKNIHEAIVIHNKNIVFFIEGKVEKIPKEKLNES